jgi:hypothetical protein
MLETLLHIGKTLRESENGLKHHRYIKSAPKRDKKPDVVYLVLPVREDFSFDFGNLHPTTDEYLIEKLFYLTYKTSDADSSIKYLWGDILYWIDKNAKEQGTYRIDEKKNAFNRASRDEMFFTGTLINKFRCSFRDNREAIEEILAKTNLGQFCYLHFSFSGKHWYQFEKELEKVNEKMLEEFLEKQKGELVLRKYLYKTLSSPEKDLKFPNFSKNNMYKTKTFKNIDEVMDLFYAIDFSLKDIIRIDKIKINVLPKGDNLKAEQMEEYFNSKGLGKHSTAVGVIDAYNQPDDFFAPFASDIAKNFTQFDVIFSKASGGSSPDVDVIELAGLARDSLVELNDRIKDIQRKVEADREKVVGKSDKIQPLRIRQSFSNILGDFSKDKKKYQSHLLKVLPQIYKGNYYRDDVLLPAFIEKTEYNIRQGKTNYGFLKFDYEFLVRLRNKNGDKEMKNMFESPSFKAGKLLGQLAQPVSWQINSFEKNYVGQLSRRISDIDGLVNLAGFICEKLAIHDKAFPKSKEKYGEFMSLVKEIQQDYDRRYCVAGFFEGYFGKFETPETQGEENNDR